jgi:hypothetical protein
MEERELYAMMITNRDLISKLLKSIILESKGVVTLSDMEGYLDELINQKDCFPTFDKINDRPVVHWNLEEDKEKEHLPFHETVKKVSDMGTDYLTVMVHAKCQNCDGAMNRIPGEKLEFKCNLCKVKHTFELVQKSEVESIDEGTL